MLFSGADLFILLKENRSTGGQQSKPNYNSGSARKVAASKKLITIKTVSIIPAFPTVGDMLMFRKWLTPLSKKSIFSYQWFVNDKEIPAAASALLKKTNFKKGAKLYCQVKAVSADGESPWLKGDVIQVNNALPVLNLAPVPPFSAPGIFRYKINASDPDNDEIAFMVIAPENEGISLEVESGLLSWKIDRSIRSSAWVKSS